MRVTEVKQKEDKQDLENLTNEEIMKTQKERDKFLISEMRKRLDHFFRINVTQVGDMVPKIISNFLVNAILVAEDANPRTRFTFRCSGECPNPTCSTTSRSPTTSPTRGPSTTTGSASSKSPRIC